MGSGIQDIAGDVSSVKNLFGGSRDKDATNDVLGGKVVATGTPGAATVADPDQGLTSAQMEARRVLAAAGQTLGSSLNRPQAQPQGRAVQFTFADNQPQVKKPLSDYAANPFFGQ